MELEPGPGIEPAQGRGSRLDLGRLLDSGGGGGRGSFVQDLAVEVADVDAVPVAEPQFPHSSRGEIERRRAAEPAEPDNEGRGGGETGLGCGWKEKKEVEVERLREKKREKNERKRKRKKKNPNYPHLPAQTTEEASACSSALPVGCSADGLLPKRHSH